MKSKFPGKCTICGKPYPKDAEIHWTRQDGASHQVCWDEKPGDLLDDMQANHIADLCRFIHYDPQKPLPQEWFSEERVA